MNSWQLGSNKQFWQSLQILHWWWNSCMGKSLENRNLCHLFWLFLCISIYLSLRLLIPYYCGNQSLSVKHTIALDKTQNKTLRILVVQNPVQKPPSPFIWPLLPLKLGYKIVLNAHFICSRICNIYIEFIVNFPLYLSTWLTSAWQMLKLVFQKWCGL